jgi:hypothetical protein
MENENNGAHGSEVDLFDLDYQYSLYLQRVGLNESTMMPIQAQETKRAWFGAAGQILDLLTDGMDNLNESQAIPKLAGLFDQVMHFWTQEINQNLAERQPDPEGIATMMKSPFN